MIKRISIHRTDGYIWLLVSALFKTLNVQHSRTLAAELKYHSPYVLCRRESDNGTLDWVRQLRQQATEVIYCTFTDVGCCPKFEAEVMLTRTENSPWRALEIIFKKSLGSETEIRHVFGQSLDGVTPEIQQLEQELYES